MELTEQKADVVLIRYNTDSNGKNRAWRMIIDGQELLVNSIEIQTSSRTSADWMQDKQVFKHHITVQNCLVRVNEKGDALITGRKPQH